MAGRRDRIRRSSVWGVAIRVLAALAVVVLLVFALTHTGQKRDPADWDWVALGTLALAVATAGLIAQERGSGTAERSERQRWIEVSDAPILGIEPSGDPGSGSVNVRVWPTSGSPALDVNVAALYEDASDPIASAGQTNFATRPLITEAVDLRVQIGPFLRPVTPNPIIWIVVSSKGRLGAQSKQVWGWIPTNEPSRRLFLNRVEIYPSTGSPVNLTGTISYLPDRSFSDQPAKPTSNHGLLCNVAARVRRWLTQR